MKIRIPDILGNIQDDYQKKYDYSRFEAQLNVIDLCERTGVN